MAKKKKGGEPEKTVEAEGFSQTGVRLMGAGAVLVVIGFFTLSKADPLGRNWAGSLSPFLILGGYALIGLGVFWSHDSEKTI